MRLRNIPGSEEAIAESGYVIMEPQEHKGKWHLVFGNMNPIRIEVGMGKGRFLMDQAEKHPEINFIGIEMYSSVLLRAVQKAEERFGKLTVADASVADSTITDLEHLNFRLIRMDARALEEVFAPGEVERIYLNFSDPWPKARHADRRLVSHLFLQRYEKILSWAGRIEFKTDNTDLFDFALEELEQSNWELIYQTRDLHADEMLNQDNIMTEYEERFSSRGQAICKLAAKPVLIEISC